MLRKKDSIKLQVPPAMRDRYVIRCTEHKFGPNSNGNPMITIQWEVVGKPNKTGSVDTSLKRGDQEYQIAGLTVNASYFTLIKGKALSMYVDFWEKANPGNQFEGVDEENPDRSFLDNLLMEAILSSTTQEMRKELTEEEKKAKKDAGEAPLGEPITDEDGKPLTRTVISVTQFLKKFTGDVPNPF